MFFRVKPAGDRRYLQIVENTRDGAKTRQIGPPLVFGRLWEETGCQAVIEALIGRRAFEFPVERAIFATVLHRLMVSGSDRACERWQEAYRIDGADGLELH